MILTNTQIQHILRNLKQRISKPEVGVIGGYHGGNLGDIALGSAVQNVLERKGISNGLQTIYNLEKWPKAPYAIVGGGAVGYSSSLSKVCARYRTDYGKVALLGVDYMEDNYSGEILDLIKNAKYISCRSEKQAIKMKAISGRNDIHFHPDIAFSLYSDFCRNIRKGIARTTTRKKLLVNLVPLYASIKEGKITPLEFYRSERPNLFENFEQMHQSYKAIVLQAVKDAISKGYEVETIPFTPQDEIFSKIILDGIAVKHTPYHFNPEKMIKKMSKGDLIIATRYHATIFALKLGIPMIPIAYATKNELLLNELGINIDNYVTADELTKGHIPTIKPVLPNMGKIELFEENSSSQIEKSIRSIIPF